MKRPLSRRLLALGVAIVVVIAGIFIFRESILRFGAAKILGGATGTSVSFGSIALHGGKATIQDVHLVGHGGAKLAYIPRVEVQYNLHDLLPGSKHRFGLRSVVVYRPQITVVHNPDGTYNLPRLPKAGPSNGKGAPLNAKIRVLDGSITVLDRTRVDPSARRLYVGNVNVSADVHTDARTTYTASMAYVEGGASYPIRGTGAIDSAAGFTLHHWTAAHVPLPQLVNYALNNANIRMQAGYLDHLDARYYGSISASGYMRGAQIAMQGVNAPIRNVHGPLDVTSAGLTTPQLTADVAGAPVYVTGGIYDLKAPKFRLTVRAHSDVAKLKTADGCSRKTSDAWNRRSCNAGRGRGAHAAGVDLAQFAGNRLSRHAVARSQRHDCVRRQSGERSALYARLRRLRSVRAGTRGAAEGTERRRGGRHRERHEQRSAVRGIARAGHAVARHAACHGQRSAAHRRPGRPARQRRWQATCRHFQRQQQRRGPRCHPTLAGFERAHRARSSARHDRGPGARRRSRHSPGTSGRIARAEFQSAAAGARKYQRRCFRHAAQECACAARQRRRTRCGLRQHLHREGARAFCRCAGEHRRFIAHRERLVRESRCRRDDLGHESHRARRASARIACGSRIDRRASAGERDDRCAYCAGIRCGQKHRAGAWRPVFWRERARRTGRRPERDNRHARQRHTDLCGARDDRAHRQCRCDRKHACGGGRTCAVRRAFEPGRAARCRSAAAVWIRRRGRNREWIA